jgi:hypothetical protein
MLKRATASARGGVMQIVDPYEAMLVGSGYALDAVGSIRGIDLPRDGVEPDDVYRSRLISKWVVFLAPAVATGEYLDQWLVGHEHRGPVHDGPTTAPPENTTKPRNHVREAVEANR